MNKQTTPKTYIINGSIAGAARLEVLAESTWQGSYSFLTQVGLFKTKSRGLDLGCGSGALLKRMLPHLHPESELWGMDSDPEMLSMAAEELKMAGYLKESHLFELWDIEQSANMPAAGSFDWILARFLLSHLKDPLKALSRIKSMLKEGGSLLIEDVDFMGSFSYPQNDGFDRYTQLYSASAIARGCDSCIGPKLPQLCREVGFKVTELSVQLPVFMKGPGKQIASLTFEAIRSSILESKTANEEECEAISKDLSQFTNDRNSIISLPRIFQLQVSNSN